MRLLISTIFTLLIVQPGQAEEFQVQMPPASVEVFAGFARVTRLAELEMPVGEHTVLVPLARLESGAQGISLRSSAGATITSFSVIEDRIFDEEAIYTPEQADALAKIEAIEDSIEEKSREIETAQARVVALTAQRAFLGSVTGTDQQMLDPDSMLKISRAIRDESEVAGMSEIGVQTSLTTMREELDDLMSEFALAAQNLAALNPPKSPSGGLSIAVTVDSPGVKQFELIDNGASAYWQFQYDVRLIEDDSVQVAISRRSRIIQNSGEPWRNVDLVLSTASIDQTEPASVRPDRASITEQDDGGVLLFGGSLDVGPVLIEPETVILKEPAAMSGVGGAVQAYASPTRVSIESGGDGLVLELDSLVLDGELTLQASPRADATAFVVAEITNDTGEHIMPAEAVLYRSDQVVGVTQLDLIRTGETAKLAFGPEQGIVVTYDVLRRESGDRGLVSKSNTREEQVEFALENLTGAPKTVRALYALPFSEQEDLVVESDVQPRPDETDVDNRRGVSAWVIELPPGETKRVVMRHRLTWPDGQVLQWIP